MAYIYISKLFRLNSNVEIDSKKGEST